MDRSNIPGFIAKLWKIVNDQNDLICWSDNGESFIIADPPRFSLELSKYFKHNNISSFIRQLNMYGFRKVATIEGTDDLHFYHPDFVRGRPERLEAIKRKLPQKISENVDLKNVIKDISEIEGRQKDVTQTLAEIKRENEMLWAELHDLRQKHQQQQLYISRLMKLVFEAMEQNGMKNVIQLRRPPPLMIEEGACEQPMDQDTGPLAATGQMIAPNSVGTFASSTTATNQIDPSNVTMVDINPTTGMMYTTSSANTPHSIITDASYQQIPTRDTTGTGATTNDGSTTLRALSESIIDSGDQLDQLVPEIAEFNHHNFGDYFEKVQESLFD